MVQRADLAAPPALDLRCPSAAVAGDAGSSDGGGSAAKVLGRHNILLRTPDPLSILPAALCIRIVGREL